MIYRLATSVAFVSLMQCSVEDTWKRTDAALQEVNAKFAEVRKRADEVVSDEEKTLEDAKLAAKNSEEVLEHLGEPIVDPEESVKKDELEMDKANFDNIESSFLELPDELKKFPGVAADMKRAQEAEHLFKEKMQALRSKDEELMKFARSNFANSHDSVKLIGHLRSRPHSNHGSSFLEGYKLPPAFAKVKEAEEELRKVNEKLKVQFNLQ